MIAVLSFAIGKTADFGSLCTELMVLTEFVPKITVESCFCLFPFNLSYPFNLSFSTAAFKPGEPLYEQSELEWCSFSSSPNCAHGSLTGAKFHRDK